MTLSQDQFRQHLLDYVYGELKGAELAAFEAQLASSEECRRELAEMRETLQLVRHGLSALEEAPPERMRSKLVALGAQRDPTPKPSFWAWLRNPGVLAVAGLATVAMLTVMSRRNPLDPKHDFGADGAIRVEHEASAPAPQHKAEEPSAEPAPASEQPTADEAQPSEAANSGAESPARARSKRAATREDARAPTRAASATSAEKLSAPAAPATGSARDRAAPELLRAAPRKYAEPPAPRASQAPAMESSHPSQLIAPGRPAAEGGSAIQSRGASAAPPSAPAAKGSEAERAEDDRFAEPPPPAPTARSLGAPTPAQLAPDDAIAVARVHAQNARWSEAARAYRELLRRYPDDPRKTEWRRQLDLMNRAQPRGHNPH
jgi:hypothetical protein